MSITDAGLRCIGFEDWPDDLRLSAAFHALHVYQAQGIVVDDDALTPASGAAHGVQYKICYGKDVGAICELLVGHNFPDAVEWIDLQNVAPPFAIIHFGPVIQEAVKGRFLMQHGNAITAYSSFRDARMELARVEALLLPSVLASQSLAFRQYRHGIRFPFLARTIFGICENGKLVRDAVFSASARGYGAGRIDREDMDAMTADGVKMSAGLDRQFAILFKAASDEMAASDWTMAFIHFFLSIEILIEKEFSKLVEVPIATLLAWANSSLPSAAKFLVENNIKKCNSLRTKFIHCIFSIWRHLDEPVYLDFVLIKQHRDKIAHGEEMAISQSIVEKSERLALKLIP